MTSAKLNVQGMKCGGCESSVKDALASVPGILDVKPSHKEAVVEIDYDEQQTDLAAIKKIISNQGFTVSD